ncbi:MAG TPA: carboxypeptidase regulatory-like domain-containing protein [Pyrinomonadaceae bacterium]
MLIIIFGLTPSVFGQTSRGTVTGTVTDSNGAVIAGASVTLTNTQTGVERATVANEDGFYRFDAVELGTYTVRVTYTRFGEVTKINVVVQANQISDVPVQLAPAGQQITVDVTAEGGAFLQTEAPVRGGNIDPLKITELPFPGRNPVSLSLTLPGVSTNRFNQSGQIESFSVNGSRGRSNNFLIDGAENNDISVTGQGFRITIPDAVQEVSVQTSNNDAEFGHAAGAVVNVITKSGTNNFHGTLGYLLDSTRDDAITNTQAGNPVVQQRGHPPAGTEQWFTGTLGGPIIPKRTFFFAAYQRQYQNSTSQQSRVVPTGAGLATLRALFPQGASANLDTYLNVIKGVTATAGPFPLIPLGLSATGVDRGAVQFGTGFIALPRRYRAYQLVTRIDHTIGEKDQLAGRYLIDDQLDPTSFAPFIGFETSRHDRFQNTGISETHIFSPRLTNELRLSYVRLKFANPIDTPSELGRTLPRFDIAGGISSIGVQTNIPFGRIANNYIVQDTMTYLHGTHTLRFGFDINDQRSIQRAPVIVRGQFSYAASPGYSAFANFIEDFGGSNNFAAQRQFGPPVYYPSALRHAYFLTDRWRTSQALTMTLGLRYENFGQPVNSMPHPVDTGLFNIDPATRTGPYTQPNKADRDNNNFAPTVGLAYSPTFKEGFLGRLLGERRTVLRMGYQVGFDTFFNNIATNALTSTPNVIATFAASVVNATTPRGLPNLSRSLPTSPRAPSPLDLQQLVVKHLLNPYYQKWSIGVQRELPLKLMVDVSYVGTKGTHLFLTEDENPGVPRAMQTRPAGYPDCTPNGTVTAAQATAQFPAGSPCPLSGRLDNLQGFRGPRTNGGDSNYHAGQLFITRRFTAGLALSGSYTYSKLIDNGSDIFPSETNSPAQSAFPARFGGQQLERAVSLYDRRHRAAITYVYELPFMRAERGLLGRLVGGWQLSGVTIFESGVPLTVLNGADADGIGGAGDRPLYNPQGRRGVRAVPNGSSSTGYINPEAGNAPINPLDAQYIGLAAGSGLRGNLGRNTLRTRGLNNWDFNVLKRVRITDGTRLEFRTEFYNIFNHPQYGQSSVSPFSPGSTAVSANVINSPAGQFLRPEFTDAGGRVIRYQVKFNF